MIHPSDAQTLQQMLGTDAFSTALVQEYRIRLKMFHACGGSGPLGILPLIDMIRSGGFIVPSEQKTEPVVVDWMQMPQDGSVAVEANIQGQWLPGKFTGFVGSGTLSVRLDDDPEVRECSPHHVRLRAEQWEDDQKAKPETAKPSREPAEFDWSAVKVGSAVWAQYDGNVWDGFFLGLGDSDEKDQDKVMRVSVNGSERIIPISDVAYVEK
jgi:hypothetical protein